MGCTQFPYLAPCLLGVVVSILALVGGFFFLSESLVKRKPLFPQGSFLDRWFGALTKRTSSQDAEMHMKVINGEDTDDDDDDDDNDNDLDVEAQEVKLIERPYWKV